MIHALGLRVAGLTDAEAAALVEELAATVRERDVTVLLSSSARAQETFSVRGVDTETHEPFEEQVDADDADDATAQVTTPTKVVASVVRTFPA
ncbi:MAG TPA: hypothetical protein VFZ00_28385 [Solirubrobacter sp.]|nr:hypothetical protein [Solirubrobacter sp.]